MSLDTSDYPAPPQIDRYGIMRVGRLYAVEAENHAGVEHGAVALDGTFVDVDVLSLPGPYVWVGTMIVDWDDPTRVRFIGLPAQLDEAIVALFIGDWAVTA